MKQVTSEQSCIVLCVQFCYIMINLQVSTKTHLPNRMHQTHLQAARTVQTHKMRKVWRVP